MRIAYGWACNSTLKLEVLLVPYGDNVEVTGSHTGLIANRRAYRAIAAALAVPELEVGARIESPHAAT